MFSVITSPSVTASGIVTALAQVLGISSSTVAVTGVSQNPNDSAENQYSLTLTYDTRYYTNPYQTLRTLILQGDLSVSEAGILSVTSSAFAETLTVCDAGYMGLACSECITGYTQTNGTCITNSS